MWQTSPSGVVPLIKFVDMFSGIGGFREGLTRAGGFECVGHCEIDKYANRSYNALFDTKGEWFIEDARKADPSTMPDFQLLCGGFPCQTFSIAGTRKGFGDPRGTLFFELARLAEARKPPYLLFENVVGLINHDHCRTFATILNTLDRLGYGVEWQCLNSKDFGVPQSRNRVYIVGYLDERCRGKVFPFTETAGSSLIQTHGGHQGERVCSPEGLSCTLASTPGGLGGKTGLYEVGVPIKCATKTGYQMAQVGDSIDLSYATVNSRRGRVGKEIAHTLTTGCQQGTVEVRPVKNPIKSDLARNTERTGKPNPSCAAFACMDGYRYCPPNVAKGAFKADSNKPSSRIPAVPPNVSSRALCSLKTCSFLSVFIWQVPHRLACFWQSDAWRFQECPRL